MGLLRLYANNRASPRPAPQEYAVEFAPMRDVRERRGGWSWWYLLFVVLLVVCLWPPFYNRADPYFIGIPFFYWFQLLLVIIGAIFTAIVYVATDE